MRSAYRSLTRRRLLATIAVLGLSLVPASAAYAAAGGGSSGYGGAHGGGRGFVIYLVLRFLIELIILHPIVLAFLAVAVAGYYGRRSWEKVRADRRRGHRARRVELAAAEASEEDSRFAPAVVRADAEALFKAIQDAWDRDDRAQLQALVGPELWVEWERRLEDFARRGWRNRVSVSRGPRIEYVGLTNRGNDREDRVVVHVRATLSDYVTDGWGRRITRANRVGAATQLDEYWTLGKRGGRWTLLSIEQPEEGEHQLAEELVPTSSSDVGRLRDESLLELAADDKLPANVKPAEVVDLDFANDARGAALDLSLVDGRYAPDVIEVAVRRVVAGWAEAVDSDHAELRTLATPQAERELLHPGDPSGRTRLVIRGPRVRRVAITGLDAASDPPALSVAVEAEGRRYVEDRDTAAVLSGSRSRSARFTEHWTLTLDGDDEQPWRLSRADAPAELRRTSA